MPPAPTVFISYSHQDEVWKDRLLDHLGGLEEEGLLKVWSDRNIKAGDEWFEEIRTAMDVAKVAVFLVSAHSLKSKFIRHQEIPHLLDRRANEGMTFFPVIVKSCVWDELPWLSRFQARPLDGRPLAGLQGNRRDAELTKIAKEILSIVRNGAPQVRSANPPDIAKLTALAPLHQLPTPPDDFTGREEDLEFLRFKLSQGGTGAIFGLRGMGGVGKTTLALKLAEELKPRFPDAQIYLDLKGVDPQPLTAAQAMTHVIRSFHPEIRLPESEAELVGLYRSILDGKRVLLLMDNAANREQIEPLIPPSICLMLVTSRSHFSLIQTRMVTRDLDEMPEKDATNLLLGIAPRIGDAAAEIAHLCGCLPHALRLAGSALAERLNLTPHTYIRRFKEGKEKLEPVEASLKTSYELLTEEQRHFWRQLAVFPETFDINAAAVVWELDVDDAESHMGDLVRNSFVEWEESQERYRLHDLSRAFAHKLATTTELEEVQRRHAEYFLGILRLADSLYQQGGQKSRLGLNLFDREWSNIQAGQAWAATRFHADKEVADLCSNYPEAGVECLLIRLHPREYIQWLTSGITAAQQLGNRSVEGHHLGNLGIQYGVLGNYQQAISFFDKALFVAREVGDRRGEAKALGNLGIANKNLGETKRAIEVYEEALVIDREIGDREGEGADLGNLGVAYAALGNYEHAIELYELRLSSARETGNRKGEGIALGNLGIAYKHLGERRRAIELFEQLLPITREIGDRANEAKCCWNLGLALEEEGDLIRAADLMQICIDYLREIGHPEVEKYVAQAATLRTRIAEQKS